MSRWTFLMSDRERTRILQWVQRAPNGFRVEIKEPKRSNDQNAKMWVCLSEIAAQKTHHGVRLSPEDWKILFMSALKQEVRMVPNLEGNGLVTLGRSTSDLSKAEFSDLLEIIHAWGAANGVVFHSEEVAA